MKNITLPSCLLLITLVCCTSGCGDDGPRETIVLADLCFNEFEPDSLTGLQVSALVSAQVLAAGWHPPGERGVWTVGPKSAVDLYLLGKSLYLDLVMATSPQLVRREQDVTVVFNGVALGRFPFTEGWEPIEIALAIPDSLVRQGPNLLELVPAATGWAEVEQEWGLHVHRIRVTGDLGRRDRERLATAVGLDVVETDYAHLAYKGRGRRSKNGERPDVLVILLDAARADHFGCYGYDRDTTPFIDSLAVEGLVYRQVYAPAPYTRCATPSILTGRNWCEHGVIHKGDALGTDLPTLAGILSTAGVHTVGISENPNVSRATACDRGFSEFYENWGRKDGKFTRAITTVERTLGTLPADRPAFAFVHLVPPHEPYRPGPKHDLFSDPGYDGPADGSVEYLKEIDSGRRSWSPVDREHLVDLYDGNLHKADAITEQIVRLWRSRRPGRELVTIVLADHGEAFAEHGRFLHNSTMYPEMLHVPLVIHPASWGKLLPQREGLRSLTDVMPMVLRIMAADLPEDRTWPRHFLEVYEGRAKGRAQILLRTISDEELGLRTPNHLAINRKNRVQELYLVQTGPGRSGEQRLFDSLIFMNLINTATNILEKRTATRQEVPEAVIDPASAKRLKSLGY